MLVVMMISVILVILSDYSDFINSGSLVIVVIWWF